MVLSTEDLSGRRFGKLQVLSRVASSRAVMWRCRCDCGVESKTYASHLKDGHTRSCGCARFDLPTRTDAERPPCQIQGCDRPARNKGFRNGKQRWGNRCEKHHSLLGGGPTKAASKALKEEPCSRCGWGEAPCDRHRMDKTKGYTKENVKVLCPNCHRLEHLGK